MVCALASRMLHRNTIQCSLETAEHCRRCSLFLLSCFFVCVARAYGDTAEFQETMTCFSAGPVNRRLHTQETLEHTYRKQFHVSIFFLSVHSAQAPLGPTKDSRVHSSYCTLFCKLLSHLLYENRLKQNETRKWSIISSLPFFPLCLHARPSIQLIMQCICVPAKFFPFYAAL